MRHALARSTAIRLAAEAPFALRPLWVDPPRRSVTGQGAAPVTVEPRVMQVLVALAQAGGEVVGRDELIERAWDGVVVGDAAINRAIARLRQLGGELGGAFAIETVTKVGYRLLVAGSEADAAPGMATALLPEGLEARPTAVAAGPAPFIARVARSDGSGEALAGVARMQGASPLSRRAPVTGGLAVAGGAGGLAWWTGTADERRARERVDALRVRAMAAMGGDWWDNQQAIALLKRAVEIDPGFAQGWGLLALAHASAFASGPESGLDAIHADVHDAAQKALALEPDNRDARAALALVPHHFRHWVEAETKLRAALERDPGHPTLNFRYNLLLDNTGRWADALARHRHAIGREPLEAKPHLLLARALWGTGRVGEATRALDAALPLWPTNDAIWQLRFTMLALSGDPAAALAMGADRQAYQGRYSDVHALLIASARALGPAATGERKAVVEAHLEARRRGRFPSTEGAKWLLALGEPDQAMTILERYLLLRPHDPPRAGAAHLLAARSTAPLFLPPMRPLWGEPRFGALLEAVGLEAYWRAAGITPDFRRASLAAR